MIFIKKDSSFEKVKSWEDIAARENYHSKLELTDQQLSDVFGYYDDLPEEIPCGKASCRTGHRKGFLVITEEGLETNLGHVCGKNVFGIAFENLAKDLESQANFHRYLTALKEAKKEIYEYYRMKAALEAQSPSIEFLAHKIIDLKNPSVIGRAAYQALKRMAGSGDGRVLLSRKKTKEETDLLDVMHQKRSESIDEEEISNTKPSFTDDVIGVVRFPESLLNDYDIALIYERDIRMVLEELNNCDPDNISEKKVMALGSRVFRLKERFKFLQERYEKAIVFITKDNLKPLKTQLNTKKAVSNKDKKLFNDFYKTLP